MERYISEALAAGLIRPSFSPVGADFFFVKKKDGTSRPCIDYWGLNEMTVRNKYPLLLLDAAFAPLQQAWVFTKLDLWNMYHLIRQGDKWKTVFNTPLGTLSNTVWVDQRPPSVPVFQDMLNKFLFVYINDILIFSETEEEHVQHV